MRRPSNDTISWGKYTFSIKQRTHIMGILNVTPDSFSDGGIYYKPEAAIRRGIELEKEGADIIDIGAESTRPGAEPVSTQEELRRLRPIIEGLREAVSIPLSIDTYKAEVAEKAINWGATIINDISGLRFDPDMKYVVASYSVPIVLMHIKGVPRNMQIDPKYDDLFEDVIAYLQKSISIAKDGGIRDDLMIIDPGIGFGKSIDDNYRIIRHLAKFKVLGKPILIGPSRKSFIGKALKLETGQRFEGTAAVVALSIANGADIVRVHDVERIKRVCVISDLVAGKTFINNK